MVPVSARYWSTQAAGETPDPRLVEGYALALRAQKEYLLSRLQQEYTQLKAQWGGNTAYDDWFAAPVNNAQLNSVAAYYDLVPGFERLLQQNGGDLEKFYEAADRLARDPKTERDRWLRTLASAATGSALPEDGTFTPPAPATMSSAAPKWRPSASVVSR